MNQGALRPWSPYMALANRAHYAVTSTFNTNRLRRRCCYKPTAHWNKSGDPVDLLEKLRFRRKLRPALQFLATLWVKLTDQVGNDDLIITIIIIIILYS